MRRTETKNQSPFNKRTIVIIALVFLAVFLTPLYFGVARWNEASQRIEDLEHVRGKIVNSRFVKHKVNRKNTFYYQHVLVLRMDSISDEFGFIEDDYEIIFNMGKGDPLVDIYYDKHAQRIEENVITDVYDMTIGGNKVIDISVTRRNGRLNAMGFFSISALFLIAALLVVYVVWGSTAAQGKGRNLK